MDISDFTEREQQFITYVLEKVQEMIDNDEDDYEETPRKGGIRFGSDEWMKGG
jgi:hypothetical protein